MDQFDKIDKFEKERKAARKRQLREEFGLPYYEPHKKQAAFHAAGKYKGRYLRTGNRFGKSDCGAAEDCAWLLGERVWLPKEDPVRILGIPNYPVKGLLICQDWQKAEEIFTSTVTGEREGKLFKYLPKRFVETRRKNKYITEISVPRLDGKGTSIIYIDTEASYRQNPLGAESSDWDFVHIDEPICQDFWTAVSRGLMDRDGKYWFTCTPLRHPWINRLFIPPEHLREELREPLAYQGRWTITGSIHDNPHISEAGKNDFLSGLSSGERACRESGIPIALSGLVYKEFQFDRHVLDRPPHDWEDWWTPPLSYTIRIFIDPHPKEPHAVSFWATAPTGETFNYHEIWETNLIEGLCANIKDVLRGRTPYTIQCDPIAWSPNPITGQTMADEFHRNGLSVIQASKQLEFGILKGQDALARQNFLYFSSNLTETLYEFDNYVWQDKKEKPIDVRDHMMENFYRACIEGLAYVDPESPTHRIPPTNLSSTKTAMRMRSAKEARLLGKSHRHPFRIPKGDK